MKPSRIRIRKAVPADKGPVVEFCKNIWRGHDYLPQVWDDWMKASNGRLAVATSLGAPVGVAHAYFQSKQVAWLEGVRVAEAYRGLGIAGKLNRVLTKYAKERGARVARLCTGSENIASRKHLEKVGFHVLQTFQRLDSARGLRRRPVEVIRPRNYVAGLWQWTRERPEFGDSGGSYSDGWTWYPLTSAGLRSMVRDRRVLLTGNSRAPRSCGIFSLEDRGSTLGFAAGEEENIALLAKYLRFLLSDGRRQRVRALLPSRSRLVGVLEDGGFEKSAKVLLYEKRLS